MRSASRSTKRRVDVGVHDQPRGRAARLALEAEVHAAHDALERRVEIGVREDHDRVLAAALERHRLHGHARGPRLDRTARLGQADERDPRHVGMRDERVAGLGAVARDDVDHAGREDPRQLLGQDEGRQRRLLGRLEDDGIAGDQRGADLHRGEQDRVVERHDPGDDAEGLAQRVVEPAVGDGNRLAAQLQGEAREVAQLGHADRDVDAHVAHGAAVVGRVEPGQLFLTPPERLDELQELGRALGRRRRAPGGEGRACGGHGSIDVARAEARELSDQLARRRVARVDRLAALGHAQLAPDQGRERLHGGARACVSCSRWQGSPPVPRRSRAGCC